MPTVLISHAKKGIVPATPAESSAKPSTKRKEKVDGAPAQLSRKRQKRKTAAASPIEPSAQLSNPGRGGGPSSPVELSGNVVAGAPIEPLAKPPAQPMAVDGPAPSLPVEPPFHPGQATASVPTSPIKPLPSSHTGPRPLASSSRAAPPDRSLPPPILPRNPPPTPSSDLPTNPSPTAPLPAALPGPAPTISLSPWPRLGDPEPTVRPVELDAYLQRLQTTIDDGARSLDRIRSDVTHMRDAMSHALEDLERVGTAHKRTVAVFNGLKGALGMQ